MTKRTKQILDRLDEQYGTEAICYLNYETDWQFLIAVILSAQCTDARFNKPCRSRAKDGECHTWKRLS